MDSGNNAVIQYQIVPMLNTDYDYFNMENETGIITLKKELDYESKENMYFSVMAIDSGIPARSSVVPVHIIVLDVSDNPPRFEKSVYECTISDLAKKGHFVTKVTAVDPDVTDQEWLAYRIVSGNVHNAFQVHEKTGVVETSHIFNSKFQEWYTLNISATDNIFTTYAKVDIRVRGSNNQAPRFGKQVYEIRMQESFPEDSLVTSDVSATDEDEGVYGTVSYSINNEEDAEYFTIDSSTGT